jgi:two-component system chemotaxis response regulator CheB
MPREQRRIKTFIVDDSAVVRQVMAEVLAADPAIEVIGSAMDPLFGLEKMAKAWPDVIVLDIEMPRMDGLTFLRKIMAERPTPVVICSSLTEAGAETTMQALSAGALGIVAKPTVGVRRFLMEEAAAQLVHSIKAAAHARLPVLQNARAEPMARPPSAAAPAAAHAALARTTDRVVAIGTSTGGTQALERLLTALPRTAPGLAIVQHMPEKFTTAFAQRLDGLAEIEVREARHNDRLIPGLALIAPGGKHMQLRRSGAQYYVDIMDGPPVNRHRPSVDVLFRSVARTAGRNALGIILTGMGDDGARGLKEMREAGALTLAQDEATSVVYGMPREAVRLGAAARSVALPAVAGEIMAFGGP